MPSSGALPDPGIKPETPALAGGCHWEWPPGKPANPTLREKRGNPAWPPGLVIEEIDSLWRNQSPAPQEAVLPAA